MHDPRTIRNNEEAFLQISFRKYFLGTTCIVMSVLEIYIYLFICIFNSLRGGKKMKHRERRFVEKKKCEKKIIDKRPTRSWWCAYRLA